MTQFSASKRRLFRLASQADLPRPPWAQDEYTYVDKCTGCGDCIKQCETQVLVADDRSQARIDFNKGDCTFCGVCLDACKSGALKQFADETPWHLKIQIDTSCLAFDHIVCQSCGDSCEAEAIRFRPTIGGVAKPELDTNLCTGCGACIKTCPTNSIAIKDTLTDEVFNFQSQSQHQLS